MPSSYSDLKFELMATGENDTTWGDKTNTNLTAIQEAITGSASVAFSSADVTLTLSNSSASQTARNLRLNLTGTATAGYNLIVPAIEKQYIVNNGTDGTITVKNSTGTGVAIPSGATTIVFNDGTNVVPAVNYIGAAGTLPISGGGTGATTASGARTNLSVPGLADANTFTARQTFSGSATDVGAKLQNALEKVTVSATAATGTINYDVLTQSVLYYTSNASANWTLNVRGSGSTSLNTLMATGEAITLVFLVTNGTTAYYQSAFQIDGSSVTPKWQGGTAPTSGNVSSIDAYTVTIVKTASATYTAFIAQTKFA